MSWPTNTPLPSHLHTQARVQPRKTYSHTYIKCSPGQNKRYYYLWLAFLMAGWGGEAIHRAPVLGLVLIAGTAIEQASSVGHLFHMVTSCILDQHQQTASHGERSIENCHRIHTRHKHTTSAWRNTHTSHTRAPIAPRDTIQTENTTSITTLTQTYNILQHFKAIKNTIFNNGRYTTNMSTAPNTIPITDIKTNIRHIHTSIVSIHLATKGNTKILRTPPPRIISSEEILSCLTRRTLAPTHNK